MIRPLIVVALLSLTLAALATPAGSAPARRPPVKAARPVQRPAAQRMAAERRLIGLCIGINRWANPEVKPLSWAVNDATELADLLREQKGRGYTTTAAIPLLNEQATAGGIRSAIEGLIQGARSQDTVVVLLSGYEGVANGTYYYLTHDTRLLPESQAATTPDPVNSRAGGGIDQTSALSWTDLSARLARLAGKCHRVLVLLDTCRSGAAGASGELVKAALASRGGVVVFASSAADEKSYEYADIRHGTFTLAVLEALRGKAARPDGTVTLPDLVSYVQKRVPALSGDLQHPQLPLSVDADARVPLFWPEPQAEAPRAPERELWFERPKPGEVVKEDRLPVVVACRGFRQPRLQRLTIDGAPIPELTGKAITLGSKAVPGAASPAVLLGTREALPVPAGQSELHLRAVVTDADGSSQETVIRLQRSVAGKGTLYLLCAGVGEYPDPKLKLQFPAQDAQAIADAIQRRTSGLYRQVVPIVLKDEQATLSRLRASLNTLRAAKAEDTVLVYLSGHGVREGDRGFFAPYDVRPQDVPGTCLGWGELVERLAPVYARKVVLADACFSGSPDAAGGAGASARSELVAQASQPGGIVVLSSSQAREQSYELAGLKHGIFTAALLQVLSGAQTPGAGTVSVSDLLYHVPKQVQGLAGGLQSPQVLLVRDFDTEAPLIRL
jgi:uncharacterized caspase-like protein